MLRIASRSKKITQISLFSILLQIAPNSEQRSNCQRFRFCDQAVRATQKSARAPRKQACAQLPSAAHFVTGHGLQGDANSASPRSSL